MIYSIGVFGLSCITNFSQRLRPRTIPTLPMFHRCSPISSCGKFVARSVIGTAFPSTIRAKNSDQFRLRVRRAGSLFHSLGCRRRAFVLPVNRFHKCVGAESAGPFPRFKTLALDRNEVAKTHQFIPFQTPQAFRQAGFRGGLGWVLSLRGFGRAISLVLTSILNGFHIQSLP
jgi:hypothetical protein